MTKREKILLIILAAVVVLSGGTLAYSYSDRIPFVRDFISIRKQAETIENNNLNVAVNNDNSNLSQNINSNETVLDLPVDIGVTWHNPEKIADQKLIKAGSDFGIVSVDYYQIAEINTGSSLILADIMYDGPSFSKTFVRFRKDSDSKFYYLKNYSDDFGSVDLSNILNDFGSKVLTDTTSVYSQIATPDTIRSTGGQQFSKLGEEYFFTNLKSPVLFTETNYGQLYKVVDNADNNPVAIRSLYLKHADGTAVVYGESMSFFGSDKIPNITLSSGGNNTVKYVQNSVTTCGITSDVSIAVRGFDKNSAEVYGQTSNGAKVYTITNQQNEIVQYLYNNYKNSRNGNEVLSMTDFIAKSPFFIYQDPNGDNVVFVKEDYILLGECGKPVVYLYPTTVQKVSVKVGAEITKSDPIYNKGWNVLAYPNGKIISNNIEYPYLFWEGQGQNYPTNHQFGFVVKSSEIKTVLTEHLTKLGLTPKERNDFLEFWLPKMPQTPYVRLTWFGNNEMNKLAPLSIEPKPDTLIRIFLDFSGLSAPIDLIPQNLSAPNRNGFTVVEWGGLLTKTN